MAGAAPWLLFALVVAAIVFAVIPWPGRALLRAVDLSITAPVVLTLAALFYLYFLTANRATRDLLGIARDKPEQMFPHSPETGSGKDAFGREELVDEILSGLDSANAGPQVVVGRTGSGKTTLLLTLAARLADKHSIVPIVLSLQDRDGHTGESLNFTELAVDRFAQLVECHARTDEETDRLWRLLRRKGRIVILADDLDRNAQVNLSDPYRTRIKLALDEAQRRRLPLVVTTRPSGLPSRLSELPIDLSDPDSRLNGTHRAATYVLDRARVNADDGDIFKRRVMQKIEEGGLCENAFYLGLMADLLRAGKLEATTSAPIAEPEGKHAVRLALLDADRSRIRGEKALDPDEWERRGEALDRIEDLGAAWLAPTDGQTLKESWEEGAVSDGERFGLLVLDDEGRPQFRHEVLHAYYASRAIARGKEWKSQLKRKPNGARVRLALELRAAQDDNDKGFCRKACDLLLEEVGGLTPDQRLQRAAGAAELAKAGRFTGRNREIAKSCQRERVNADSVAKRAALSQLETLDGDQAVEALWDYAQDDDYGTRWAAVESLIRRCLKDGERGAETCELVESRIAEALAEGRQLSERGGEADDSDRRIMRLKQAAWMLPSLRTHGADLGAEESPRGGLSELYARFDAHLQELLRLEREGVTRQRGLEASIAQGFKTDALQRPHRPVDPDAEKMLRERAVFWYSQLNLVHALALRMATSSDYGPHSLKPLTTAVEQRESGKKPGKGRSEVATRDLHPVLGAAVKLCKRALKGSPGEERQRKMTTVVWKDEGVVVSRRPGQLDPAAARLAGEIAVLLNLHETGSETQRRTFSEKVTLPHCLQGGVWHRLKSGGWRRFEKDCPKTCNFDLCPFQPARDKPPAHRELSRAFCRDQHRQAGRRPHLIRRVPPKLWEWLEARARS